MGLLLDLLRATAKSDANPSQPKDDHLGYRYPPQDPPRSLDARRRHPRADPGCGRRRQLRPFRHA
ncbi:MAG: hypothetical protein CSA73_00425, partial [Rhodobacterales bacterium]